MACQHLNFKSVAFRAVKYISVVSDHCVCGNLFTAALGNEYAWLFPLTSHESRPVSPRYLSFTLRESKVIQMKQTKEVKYKCQTSSISKPNIFLDIGYDYIICITASVLKDNRRELYGETKHCRKWSEVI